ncbi:MAG: phosphoadenylyl-sulfate reductase [Bacteroidia bacterium]|nr:phosphoadenylyl-sulfate reductase [Bacteroidia bacterium]
MNLEELNKKYLPLSPLERIQELKKDFKTVLYTSSFGGTAAYLIHLFHLGNPEQVIHFLDTTYHFPETLSYKKELTELLNLNVVDLKGDEFRNKFTRTDETWKKDPDLCCSINKVEPLEKIKVDYEVWVSGLMHSQNEIRSKLSIFEARNGILKFYPIIDVTEEEAKEYILKNNLPLHPLKLQGYNSIGCTHCTTKGKAREGRWINKSKTECGLHL